MTANKHEDIDPQTIGLLFANISIMKKIISLLFTLIIIPVCTIAQDWKEYCVTAKGDTLRIGDRVILQNVPEYKFVKPSKYFHANNLIEQQPVSPARYGSYTKYLHNKLKGDIVTITRFTRYKKGKEYTPIAVFEVKDPDLTFTMVDYTIDVNNAIDAKEIEVVR